MEVTTVVDDSDRVYRPNGNGSAQWHGAGQPWPPDEPATGSTDHDGDDLVHGGPPVPPPPPPIRVPAPPAPPPINRPGMAAPAQPGAFPPGAFAPQSTHHHRPPAPPPPPPHNAGSAPRPPHPGQPPAPPAPPHHGVPAAQHGQPAATPPPHAAGPAARAPHGPGPHGADAAVPASHQTGPGGHPPHETDAGASPPHQTGDAAPPPSHQMPAAAPPRPAAAPPHQAAPAASNGDGPRPMADQPPADQSAAVPMQRSADGQVAGTPWAQPPQRPPTTAPQPAEGPAAHPTAAYPVTPPPRPVAAEPAAQPDPPPVQHQEIAPGVVEVPQQGVYRMPTPSMPPATASPRAEWAPDGAVPTADDFARRRAMRAPDPVATSGVRAVLNRSSMGLVKLPPGAHERERRQEIDTIRRNFGGLRQVTVVNPKGGAGKTVAILLLAMTFGQKRGGYVLAWDNNETQGTLGMRAQQDFHNRTVRDLLRDLAQFRGAQGRVGDLSQYVRAQGEGMFDVLASDESATAGEMLTAAAFAHIRDVVSRFYKLIFVDTGNNVRAQNWQAAIDATDQLVVTMSARNDSAETAARMLDHLEQTGRHRLVRQAVTVVSMPPSRREIDLPPIESHFAARTRSVLLAPYERLIDTGEPLRYAGLSRETRDAWLKIAAAVAEGL
ncbi:chromosome partitioning protein [Asanoa sp. NPDC050611]|uniref:chromosome partitioning protein n=1 Tax=Asanoa sp. NPDC050611 TaxID=3157098 RepID=UPI003404F526